MKNIMYIMKFNFKEFMNLLFKQKRCKLCGNKLTKHKYYTSMGYTVEKSRIITFKGELIIVHFKM